MGVKSWRESSWGGRIKLVVFSLLPVGVLLVLAETFASIQIYRDISVEEDPLVGGPAVYHMHFGRLWWGRRTETPLNSLGFPDDEFLPAEGKGECVHVVFAGDSFTFGDAVDRHRNFVSLVERAFARSHPGACVRFFNLGQRETTIEEQREHIRSTKALLRPDVVILGQYQNDLTDLTNPGNVAYVPPSDTAQGMWWGDVLRERVPFANAALVRYLSYHAFAFLVTRDIPYDILRQWSVLADTTNRATGERLTSIYRTMYLELVEELRSEGIEFGVVIMPSKLDLMAGRYPEGEYFAALAREAGVPALEVFADLDRNRREYPYQMYDGHLSEAGNEVVAQAIVQWIGVARPDHPFPALLRAISPEPRSAKQP
jgi:hypothetical protein